MSEEFYSAKKILPSMNSDAALTLSFRHNIFYSNHGPIPASQVAEALLALDRIVQRSPKIFQKLAPGSSLPKVQLYVEKLTEGSLAEDVFVSFFFGSKAKMDRTIKAWRKTLGIDLNTKSGVLRAIIIGLILVGGYAAINYLSPSKPSIQIQDSVIINVAASDLKMTPDDLVKVIESSVTRQKALAKDAAKFLSPAKKDPKAIVRFDSKQELTIPSDFIAAIPENTSSLDDEKVKLVQHAEIHLRASDLDSSDKGWAAVIPSESQRRLRLELSPEINADDLFGQRVVRGTVEAISRKDAYDRYQLRSYLLVSLDPEQSVPEKKNSDR